MFATSLVLCRHCTHADLVGHGAQRSALCCWGKTGDKYAALTGLAMRLLDFLGARIRTRG
jgi:hypothetical protein